MLSNEVLQLGIFCFLVLLLTVPLGRFIKNVFSDERTFLDPILRPVERIIFRVCGINPATEMGWAEYAIAMLLFSVAGMICSIRSSGCRFPAAESARVWAVGPPLAFNTAASFTTNTNWQAYGANRR